MLARRAVLAFAAAAAATPLRAQSAYPNRPIRLLVGFSAGGGVDAMARLLAQKLSPVLGQSVVVENRAGASGLIAADAVAKAAPDGYTLLMGESSMLIAPHLGQKLAFDPVRSFTPVAHLFNVPLMIVANNDVPARTPAELIALLKAHPGKFSYATSGVGTVHHLGFEMMKARTRTFVVHVPYRGAAQIVPDVISGQVPLGVVSVTAGLAQAAAGKLKAIAFLSPVNMLGAEKVPALADALPGFSATPRLFLEAPAGTPAAIVDRLAEAVRGALTAPETMQAAALQGSVPAFEAGPALTQTLEREAAQWGEIIRAQGLAAK
jgi:tripartite-type tricarboxylate transporter receptor subunit TctC